MVTPERVLVRLPNHLGDVMMARPLLAALRAGLPRAELRAAGPAPLLALLANDRTVDALEPGTGGGAWVARMRAWGPQVALVLPPSFSSAWSVWRTGAGARLGYRGEGRRALLTHAPARPPRGDRHLADEYLDLAGPLGVQPAAVGDLVPSEPGRAAARALLATTATAGAARGYALLGPGAIYGPAKRWPAERFAEVGRTLAGRGLAVLVCGTAAEREVCARVADAVGAGATALAGVTTLEALAALAAGAAAVVCNDSGLAHLAAATGAATVAVFGSTSSAWTAPGGRRVAVVQRPPVCAPCFQRTCRVGYRCLEAVRSRDVMAALDGLGARGRAA